MGIEGGIETPGFVTQAHNHSALDTEAGGLMSEPKIEKENGFGR